MQSHISHRRMRGRHDDGADERIPQVDVRSPDRADRCRKKRRNHPDRDDERN